MCGIFGAILDRPSYDATAELHRWLKRGLDLLAHRGPDADGWIADETVFLGSRRLRIHDVSSRADQPFESHDGRHAVLFNGAIFNYRDLRTQLVEAGYRFETNCDTEVVLNALMEWGPDAFLRFDGMYAIAWYDRKVRRLTVARDKLGIKPLYYYYDDALALFASEIKPILAHPKVPRQLNKAVIPEFLAYQFVMPPDTMFERIRVLPPGCMMVFDAGTSCRPKISHYWRLDSSVLFDPAAPSVEEALNLSVERVWDADRNSGIQLSGGVDSSLITAISHEQLSMRNLDTYSVIFDDSKSCYYRPRSEEKYIRRVNDTYDTNANLYLFDDKDIRPALAEAIWWHEAPLQGPSTCLYMLFARAISEHVTVLLTGEGADDIFLGYFADWDFNHDPLSLFKFFIERDKLESLVGGTGVDAALAKRLDLSADPCLDDMTPCQKASVMTIQTVLHGLLARHDRMFMASSIEGRPPFCSDALLKARFALPDDEIHNGVNGKLVLKKLAERYFDHDFAFRRKIGFSAPFGDWCADPNIWHGYVNALNLEWLASVIDISPILAHQQMAESAEKWSMQNLNLIFSVTQLQLLNDIFIESADPLSPQSWMQRVPGATAEKVVT